MQSSSKKNTKKPCKYIFVSGGVLSGVGKGITAASMGAILKAKGYKVTMQKCDPYLNVDAGLLNPVEHGECFVTHDGIETDLDLGHYERFLDFETSKYSITLSGSIYKELIERERAGGFHGKTVQLVPHFTDLVQEKIALASKDSDIHIVEIGGTVGDYEVCWFTTEFRYINDDGSYGQYVVFYHAEIAVREGILEFEDRITTADGYADFDESDFSADLESWREVE